MFRLTREVRFSINLTPDRQLEGAPTNSFGGFPTHTGLGHYFALDVTVAGELDPTTQYLLNIKRIDETVRSRIVPLIGKAIGSGRFKGGATVARAVLDSLQSSPISAGTESIVLHLTPTLSLACFQREHPMVRLSQKFEFSASHRLHNPGFSDEQNRQAFGKCNNPNGHGHNYELQVTLIGDPDENGVIVEVPAFERIVSEAIIQRFDHRNLNTEVPEFRGVNPTVENIARVIHGLLKPALASPRARLHSVTVWETPKTWCEFSDQAP